ncbi:non-ribosomal peptide synthetase [Kitasatospora viridis]|uniref:Amino acid adenylation domain-containing protein n=1 Tax=Kitasatospora viridis TaxID=281105 RepID=A0A561T6E9_9ACTN|nr:non-ribosomal peptide synthetase [Kitasatospora viridis]TWF82705.1 amino acid adenylation domain-containing protein [Kitasatospora viridis]
MTRPAAPSTTDALDTALDSAPDTALDTADRLEPVHRTIARHARRTPDAPALVEDGRTLTYRELDAAAARVAAELRRRGAGPGQVVAVLAPRGTDAVVGALGVLRAGAAYLPLDPAQPRERLAGILRTAAVELLVAADSAAALAPLPADRVLLLDACPAVDEPSAPAGPADLAYVVFTSGSTGEPKGVLVGHDSLANLCAWHRQAHGTGPADRFSAVFSPGFDGAVAELWPALTAGAQLHLAPASATLEPARLRDWLLEHRITVSLLPTPLAEALLALDWPADCALRVVHAAGDRLRARPAPELPFAFGNAYGPTENTVWSTEGPVTPDGEGLPDLGLPVAGALVRVLDEELREAPVGEPGELYLAGPGLARGYVNRPALTADRFVPDPTRPGARMYRTGDLASRRPDGRLDFLGRTDRQIKLRGFRIEPGEVEMAVRSHETVADAHVMLHQSAAGDRLVAYLVPTDLRRWTSPAELRAHVADRLPEYLRPGVYVALERMPLTVNGKVDVAALPEPPRTANRTAQGPLVAPRTALERAVAAAWCAVLCLAEDELGVHDEFFELGGYSLLAGQIVERLRAELGRPVPITLLFEHPTVAGLAARLAEQAGPAAVPGGWQHSEEARHPLSLLQEEVWFLAQLAPRSVAYSTQTTLRVRGPLDLDLLDRALTAQARRHSILRTSFVADEDGRPWQIVRDPVEVRAERLDLRELSAADQVHRVRELVAERAERPFDLGRPPLYRWTACRLAEQEYELILVEHHFVHDGWSYVVLTRELGELYDALRTGRAPQLPELDHQYADFARWQRSAATGPELAGQRSYWLERLAGAPQRIALPTDRPRPRHQTFHGGRLRFDLPPQVPSAVRELARRSAATPYMVMLAAFVLLLHRRTGERDLCVGSGFANRRKETEHLIGMFVNSVVLRNEVPAGASFRDLLAGARKTVVDAAANQEFPFVELVRALRPPRELSANPLFQVMFNFHDTPTEELTLAGAPVAVYEHENESAKTDLNIIVIPHGSRRVGTEDYLDDRMTVLWEYSADLFDRATVEAMAAEYVELLTAALADPDAPVA